MLTQGAAPGVEAALAAGRAALAAGKAEEAAQHGLAALEGEPRVGLGGLGRRRRTPGEVELVGARVAGVAGPGPGDGVAGQLQRREARQVPDLAGDHLVDGDAGADVGGALLEAHAGEERAVAAGVVAGAVRPGVGRLVVEAAEDVLDAQALEDRLLVARQSATIVGAALCEGTSFANSTGFLLEHHPATAAVSALSIVLVGINNLRNLRGIDDAQEPAPRRARGELRIVRLFHLLRAAAGPRPSRPEITRVLSPDRSVIQHLETETGEVLIEHQVRPPPEWLDLSAAAAVLRRDLERLRALHDAAGVELVLLTYTPPSTAYGTLNEETRRFARRHGLRLVDAGPRFEGLLRSGASHSDYFLSETDDHPNAEGYAEIARLVADLLEPGAR